MFFIARTTAAMLTGSCGSGRTTRTRVSGSGTIDDDGQKACGRLTVSPEIDPATASAQDKLPPTANAIDSHLVDDHVHRERNPTGRAHRIEGHLEAHLIATLVATPCRNDWNVGARAIDSPNAHVWLGMLWDHEPRGRTIPIVGSDIELYAVAVNVGMLVVERRISRLTRAKHELLLLHGHDNDQTVIGRGESDFATGAPGLLPVLL